MKRFTVFLAAALLLFSSFSLTAHAATKKGVKTGKEIAVTYKWLGQDPRFKGGYVALIVATPEQQVAFGSAAEEQIKVQTGLEGDGDSIADQIAKQLADKSAKAVIIPAGTTMSYMGSGKGTVFGQFVLAESLAGHAFSLNLQKNGQKYVGVLKIFDKCVNEMPLDFSAVPVESPTAQLPPVKSSLLLFEGGYRYNAVGAHQLERGYLGMGIKVAKHTKVYVGGGLIGSQKAVAHTTTICR